MINETKTGRKDKKKKSGNVDFLGGNFDLNGLGIDNMEDDEHMELTEEDLRDPALLSELQELGIYYFLFFITFIGELENVDWDTNDQQSVSSINMKTDTNSTPITSNISTNQGKILIK